MERSYFVYKFKAKNKIKENFERIKRYETSLDKMESSINHQNLVQTIKFLKKSISEMKKEIKIEINIICHG